MTLKVIIQTRGGCNPLNPPPGSATAYPVLEKEKTGHFGAESYADGCSFGSLKSLQSHSFTGLTDLSDKTSKKSN